MPSEAVLSAKATETLLEFDAAIQAKNFTSFYSGLAEAWKAQSSPDDLAQAFRMFTENEIFITGIKDVQPVVGEPPSINNQGVLVFMGHYPTTPFQVVFDLRFIYEESE